MGHLGVHVLYLGNAAKLPSILSMYHHSYTPIHEVPSPSHTSASHAAYIPSWRLGGTFVPTVPHYSLPPWPSPRSASLLWLWLSCNIGTVEHTPFALSPFVLQRTQGSFIHMVENNNRPATIPIKDGEHNGDTTRCRGKHSPLGNDHSKHLPHPL